MHRFAISAGLGAKAMAIFQVHAPHRASHTYRYTQSLHEQTKQKEIALDIFIVNVQNDKEQYVDSKRMTMTASQRVASTYLSAVTETNRKKKQTKFAKINGFRLRTR